MYSLPKIFKMTRRNIKQTQLTFCGPYTSHFCLKQHKIWHTCLYLCYNAAQKISNLYSKTNLQKYKFSASKKVSWIVKKFEFFSNLLENKAITPKKPCVAQEMTHNLLVPCVYIFNKPRKWTFTCFFLRKLAEKVVWQKCPRCKKKCAFFFVLQVLWIIFHT